MVGAKAEIESHAHLRHCHDHALQLAVGETIKARDKMRSNLDAAFEMNKLTRYSMVKNHGKKSNTL